MNLFDDIVTAYGQAGLDVDLVDLNGRRALRIDCPDCGQPATLEDLSTEAFVRIFCESENVIRTVVRGTIAIGEQLPEISAYIEYQPEPEPEPEFLGYAGVPPWTPPPKLRVLDTRLMLTTPPPPLDWLADGIFCRGKLTLFGGREKQGKSLIQLAIAVCMASGGGTVAGINIDPGRVLIIDAENGQEEIHRRLRAMGLEPRFAENLTVAEARGFDLRENLQEVGELACDHRSDLVLLDSFRELWRGDERKEDEVRDALAPVRDLAHDERLAISLTHHLPKHGVSEYRGSTAIGAAVEHVLVLARHDEDPDKATRRRLTNPLARFAPERPERWLKIVSDGDDGPVSIDTADAFVPSHETPAQDEIERALRDLVGSVVPVVHPLNHDDPVPRPSWTTADLARAVGRKRDDKTVRRAVQRIADAGLIHRNGDNHWTPTPTLFDDEEAET